MLSSCIIIFFQCIQYNLEVLPVAQEISIAGINKNSFYIMLFDIIRVSFLDIKKVLIRDVLLVGTISFFYVLLQSANRGVQVDQKVGLNELVIDNFKNFLVQAKLFLR